MKPTPLILVVDNYDSFVYNLVQYLGELGADVTVRRNDEVGAEEIADLGVDGVVISPGPGYPRSAGNCLAIVRECASLGVPLLGVCLGHQALAEAFGGTVGPAPELRHGRASVVTHDGLGIFAGVANPLVVGRYHSLVVSRDDVPEEFVISAECDGLVMAIRHRETDLEGVQFHPESVLTQDGYRLLANWLARCGVRDALERATSLAEGADLIRAALPRPRGT